LIKLLPDEDKEHLVQLAELLALSDKPLLWDGKTADEPHSTDRNNLSIREGKQERELITDLMASSSCPDFSSVMRRRMRPEAGAFGRPYDGLEKNHRLVEILKEYPVAKLEKDDPEIRTEAALTVLRELLKDKEYELPHVPKVILYELMLIAWCDGHISDIELALLRKYQRHAQLEDFIFDDILERTKALNEEVSKALAIVLE